MEERWFDASDHPVLGGLFFGGTMGFFGGFALQQYAESFSWAYVWIVTLATGVPIGLWFWWSVRDS